LVRQWGGVPDQRFLWDRGHLYATMDSALTGAYAQYSYYPGADRPHAVLSGAGGNHHYVHSDALGNVRALTKTDNSIRRTYAYDEWGQLKGGFDSTSFVGHDRPRFKGALWMGDAGVELYYMRNRWYEPKTGRFLSEDPIGFGGGVNQYAFGGSDPVDGRDPLGLRKCERGESGHWDDDGPPESPPPGPAGPGELPAINVLQKVKYHDCIEEALLQDLWDYIQRSVCVLYKMTPLFSKLCTPESLAI
jgi:RHS repeat-associated protein